MNQRIIRIICPNPERMELYFDDSAVLMGGIPGDDCWFTDPGQMEWLAPPEKAGRHLTEAEQREIIALEPVLRAARENRIVFLYEGELYRAAAVLAEAVHEKRLRFWIARRRLRKAFPELPKGIPDSVLGRAYFDTR